MIGVIVDPAEQDVVREFFELFKTPWEFYRNDQRYEVVLCTGADQANGPAKLLLLYAGRKTQFDDENNVQTEYARSDNKILSYRGDQFPIYGDIITFLEKDSQLLVDETQKQCVAYLDRCGDKSFARIGYDLFGEVRRLLTVGQPPTNANLPTLELHIAFLRDLITACGVSLAEIPPIPDGYRFIACLTHDVDNPSIRQHNWDHTIFGFLYRAVFGSLRRLMRRQMSVQGFFRNWLAALRLPFVHLGLSKDFWHAFEDSYMELEKDLRSTFFVIPFKDRPGRNSSGVAPTFRAARYGAADIADTIQKLMIAGCEVGLHGIDAWCDSAQGRVELEEIRRLTGVSRIGVRMHWLYYDQRSPIALESSGAAYDSTIGYNETVGYRAGTTQAYKPLGVTRLLELPLHVMDTALFYPAYLGLSPGQARTLLGRIADNAVQFGGCLTVNWHDRSLAPERLWDTPYRELVQDIRNRGAWFATAIETVTWFQKRRSVVFERDPLDPDAVRARVLADNGRHLPILRLRIHRPRESYGIAAGGSEAYVDIAFDESLHARVPFTASC